MCVCVGGREREGEGAKEMANGGLRKTRKSKNFNRARGKY